MTEPSPYETPKSEPKTQSLETQLINEQNIWGTLIGCVVGSIPGFLLFYYILMLANYYPVMMLAYCIPGLSMGFFAAYMGRGIFKSHRFVGAATSAVLLFIFMWLTKDSLRNFSYLFLNIPIVAFICTRKLTVDQEDAIFDYKIGRKSKDF